MKRADNCVSCKVNHINSEDDYLVFRFAKSKGRQDGEEHVVPWHVYDNPKMPHLCPVFSIARYLFTYPQIMVNNASLFMGSSQYDRYSNFFAKLLLKHEDAVIGMGVNICDLGTHYCRKGVATMVAAGCTVSPPIVSICVRAGWVMGGVKDKYLKIDSAGNQHVGRCASCLPILSMDFAVSPP